ncbi:glycine cleavage system protein R [Thalassomonas sp. M1454]|uniref:glycine cleavage system protein R n=1 Tax=Thalassomonas sp. M1454 TaxID=2594477 RepID=UPI0011802219|nr:ACT domain-containing protein [Thalassomonas sp. M1454]TRX56713.1 transcriptional regulator [Thalassomonas sp. M1454]
MTHSLVFTAIGKNRTGIVSEITKLATDFGCNIVDSRMAILGSEFTLIMLLNGKKSAINQIETRLPILAYSLELLTISKRSTSTITDIVDEYVHVNISGTDTPGMLKTVTEFFAKRNIDLSSLKSITDDKTNTVATELLINLTKQVNKQQLHNELQKLCDKLAVTLSFTSHQQESK